MVTIVLADDHDGVRQIVKDLLEYNPEFKVVGEASDGLEAIEVIRELMPDILITDISMPDLDGLEVIQHAHSFHPKLKVVVISIHSDVVYMVRAFRSGALGYIVKGSSDSLVHAVETVIAGHRYISPPFTEAILEVYEKRSRSVRDKHDILTNREREILQALAEGQRINEIAHRLGISPKTVETHRANIRSKLGLSSSSAIVKYAIEKGLVIEKDAI